MKLNYPRLVQELLTPEAVRERCDEIFAVAELGGLLYFDYCPEKLDSAVELVLEEIYQNYPNAPVPFIAAGDILSWMDETCGRII